MTRHRTLSTKNEFYLPKETYLTTIHFCRQYPDWERELTALSHSSRAITYDQDRVQASNDSDPTSDLAVRRAAISRKKDMVDQAAQDAAGDLWKWMVLGACYDHPFYQLVQSGMPCGRTLYYELRRKFYYEVAKKI